mgnify:CR=1 FL=1
MIDSEYREYAKINFVPIVREKTRDLLMEKIKEINPQKILEIGTAIGYSGILMLLNSNASLVTLEIDENMYKIAKSNFQKENLTNRVNIVLGDAKNYLENSDEKFDFIFLDGPKSKYIEYLPKLIKMLNTNGLIFCDNVLFKGLVKSKEEPPKKYRTIVRSLRKFLYEIENNNNLNVKVLDLEDGVALIKFKNESFC